MSVGSDGDPVTQHLQRVAAYVCRTCGFSPTNRAGWCDLGCGRDYNTMFEIGALVAKHFEAEREAAEAEKKLCDMRGQKRRLLDFAQDPAARFDHGGWITGARIIKHEISRLRARVDEAERALQLSQSRQNTYWKSRYDGQLRSKRATRERYDEALRLAVAAEARAVAAEVRVAQILDALEDLRKGFAPPTPGEPGHEFEGRVISSDLGVFIDSWRAALSPPAP